MTINTGKYTMTLNDDAIPSVDQCEARVDAHNTSDMEDAEEETRRWTAGGND
jgi:hypothetical protein